MQGRRVLIFGLVLMAFVFLAYGCSKQPTGGLVLENKTIDFSETAQSGDIVKILYVLKLEDGTIVDTNNASLAEQAGLKNYAHGPSSIILGKSGKVKGFDEAIIGMREGDKKTAVIEPSETPIRTVASRIQEFPRTIEYAVVEKIPVAKFRERFGVEPVVGSSVYEKDMPWQYKVVGLDNKKVVLRILADKGDVVVLPGTSWNSTITFVGNTSMKVVQNFVGGEKVTTPFGNGTISVDTFDENKCYVVYEPKIGDIVEHTAIVKNVAVTNKFVVTNVTGKKVYLEQTDNLAAKRLLLEVELVELVKNS